MRTGAFLFRNVLHNHRVPEEFETDSRPRWRRFGMLFGPALAVLAIVFYFHGVPDNPPGFFVDESSIAYNAHLIARGGADEHGQSWPLLFRAFGEYKSPVYIYFLAALYKLTGPNIFSARLLSALLGIAAALVLGLVAARSVQLQKDNTSATDNDSDVRLIVGLAVGFTALITPWLFEISRLVFEVALMPLALALLLLAIVTAPCRHDWRWSDSAAIALALTLITYTYSVGRLLAPLLAFGLLFFGGRGRWWRTVFRTWFIYGVTLVPLVLFNRRHPGALGSRFGYVSYITPTSTWSEIAHRFIASYAGSFNPWLWLVTGDPEPRHHVQTMGSLLVAPVILAVMGLIVVLARRSLRRDPWWRFVLYGVAIAPIPSALTIDHFHTLRLVALPIFLLVLSVPALTWLLEGTSRARRTVLVALIVCTLAQGALFRWQFHRAGPFRWHNFDTFYPQVFEAAIRMPNRPIYLIDNVGAPGYMHAYWYATLKGLDTNQFIVLPKEKSPPRGALVISTELPCTNCRMILERASFRAYIQK